MSQSKILVVEDELIIAESLANDLEELGYEIVDQVTSGAAAIASVVTHKPDLILMDIALQGEMDGIETAIAIQAQANTPVVYLTSYADEKTLQRSLATNSFGYILKPYKERELRAVIETALKKHREQLAYHQALEIAELRHQDQSRYIEIAAHELNNPLTTIKLSTDLLSNSPLELTPERKAKFINRIQAAVDSMDDLISNTMTFSQADAGKLVFAPSPIDVKVFCLDLIDELQAESSNLDNLTFRIYGSVPESLPKLDVKLMHPIFKNLLSNAIKYSPSDGNIKFEVVFDTTQIIFLVCDRGIGIPKEYLGKLFQRFERAGNVGKIKGTGLGLSIVKQLVEIHQGTIAVTSELNFGTTFTVTLPCT
jgi:signal transduction histidine kinase